MIYSHFIAAGAALAIGASGAWYVQGNRYAVQITELEKAATEKELTQANQAVQDMAGFQKGLNDALQQFQATQQQQSRDQQDLNKSLLDLRSATGGMRNDFAQLPSRIERASRASLATFANTCTDVLEAMATEGSRLAEGGAGIAAKADEHSARERMMFDVWPRTKRDKLTSP